MARKAYNGYTEKSYYDNTKFSGVVASTDALNEGNFKEMINLDISDTGASVKPRKGFLTTATYCPNFNLTIPEIGDIQSPTKLSYTKYYSTAHTNPEYYFENCLTNFLTHSYVSDFTGELYIDIRGEKIHCLSISDGITYASLPQGYSYYKYTNGEYIVVNEIAGNSAGLTDTYYISKDDLLQYTCVIYDGLPFTYEAQVLSVDLSDSTGVAKHAGNIIASGMCVESNTPILIPSDSSALDKSSISFKFRDSTVPTYWSVFKYGVSDTSIFKLPKLNISATDKYIANILYLSFDSFKMTVNDNVEIIPAISPTTGEVYEFYIRLTSVEAVEDYDTQTQGIYSALVDGLLKTYNFIFRHRSNNTLLNVPVYASFTKGKSNLISNGSYNSYIHDINIYVRKGDYIGNFDMYNSILAYLTDEDSEYALAYIQGDHGYTASNTRLINCMSDMSLPLFENSLYIEQYRDGNLIEGVVNNYYNDVTHIESITVSELCYQFSSSLYPTTEDIELYGAYANEGDEYVLNYMYEGYTPFYANMEVSLYPKYKLYIIPEFETHTVTYNKLNRTFYINTSPLNYIDCSKGNVFIPNNISKIYYVPNTNDDVKQFYPNGSGLTSKVSRVVLQNMVTPPTYFNPFSLVYNNAIEVLDLTNIKLSPYIVQLQLPAACPEIPSEYAYNESGSNLARVVLPYCCMTIHPSAFKNCTALFDVTFPESIVIIWSNAFEDCKLRGDIEFSNTLSYIYPSAFANACDDVSSISFISNVNIYDNAFEGYNGKVKYLSNVTINENAFGSNATFIECLSITFDIVSDVVSLKHNNDNVMSFTYIDEVTNVPESLNIELQILDVRYEIATAPDIDYYNESDGEYYPLSSDSYVYNNTERTITIYPTEGKYYTKYIIVPETNLLDISGDTIYFDDVVVHKSGVHTIFINKKTTDNITSLFGYVYTNMDSNDVMNINEIKYALPCDNLVIFVDTRSLINYCKYNSNIYNPDNVLSRLYIPEGVSRITTPMINEFNITRGILRVYYRNGDSENTHTDPQIILAFTYRESAVIGTGTANAPQYLANSLIVEAVDTQTQYSIIENNIASKRSIIPEDSDKQIILTPDEIRKQNINGFINSFDFLYTRENKTNKYLIEYTNDLDVTIIPSFKFINEVRQGKLSVDYRSEDGTYVVNTNITYGNDLLYTYKILSTQTVVTTPSTPTNQSVYYGPVCNLITNENVSKIINDNGDYDTGVDSEAANSANHNSIFTRVNIDSASVLQCNFEYARTYDPNMIDLDNRGFFMNGLHIEFYIIYAPYTAYLDSLVYIDSMQLSEEENVYNMYAMSMSRTSLESLSVLQSKQLLLTSNPTEVTYMDTVMADNYNDKILHADGMIVFKPVEGDRLVLWKDNVLYMSEANTTSNTEGFFKVSNMFTFDEPIVKAIVYKTLILVFTTQTLYAVYPYTDTTSQEEQNDEGETTIKQVEYIAYAKLPVLYNIMCSKKYSDAIQVYNQMILFYSSDGQMFLIKPSTTIDSDTRFTLQYFNKSVNDVLLNYDAYINERVKYYNIDLRLKYPEHTDKILCGDFSIPKNDIKIKVQSNINFIKIYYCVPGVITYVLIYNVLNNYWYMYDTVTFTDINEITYIQSGDLFITKDNGVYYLTFPYADLNTSDNNYDMAIYNNFSRESIKALIDTGNLNLNNHLRKRFRNLHITYKNLNATFLKFNLDVIVDDIIVDSNLISTTFDIKEINNLPNMIPVDHSKYINLLEDNTLLFNLSSFTSNKILTYTTNIPNMGNVIRFKIYLDSNGIYKMLAYGIVYKERTV